MALSSIAMNRFGLGARPDEAVPVDSQKWLTAQFESFNPRPAEIAAAPNSRAVSEDLAKYLEDQRQLRQQYGPARRPGAALADPPAMSGSMAGTITPPPSVRERSPRSSRRRRSSSGWCISGPTISRCRPTS